jgi:pSer/pThr/pTyr-binding forkhead associated (FHA) protein
MARLKVLLRGALISEIVLQNEKEYIGGRKEGSDIRLQAEKGISREHFKLKFADGKWSIQAVSRFGDIFSMGQKIEQATLEHGQSFQIPPYEFQLLEVPDSDVALSSEMSAPINENEKTVIGVSPQVPYIKIVNSNGETREMLRLEVGELWVAGRDPSCQIIIPDQRVSRRQFEIHKVNGAYTVIDLASVNGTFLNGSPVSSTDPQSLKSGDAITVLDNTMYFELHDPNFKYKVEKIEIPPLQLEQPEEVEDVPLEPEQLLQQAQQAPPNYQPLPVEIPQIQQDQINPQLNTMGGPFTGVPPNFDPNQFYTFVPPQPAPPQKKGLSPLMLVIIILIIGGGAFYMYDSQSEDTGKKIGDVADPSDPLAKLTPEQRTQVKELYSMAEQMLTQEKWGLAGEKLRQLHEIIKDGYLDSKAMQARVAEAEATKEQQLRDEEVARIQKENLAKIAEAAAKCEKLLTPQVTVEQMSECLAPIAQIDATSPEYVRLTAEAERLQRERELKAEQKKAFQEQVEELASVFKKAESIQNEGYAFKAIEQYKKVIASELPDPKKLKDKSKQRIDFIQQKISEKTAKNIEAADALAKDGKLRDAVAFLREALVYDPNNIKLTQKIETYREELKRQSRLLYQESIIDESYGIVDSTETRQGAKDKWKKIVEIDVDDGEYYRKAVIKLRRYGAL